MKRIEKIAIANRGEVAVRIIQACRDLGIDTVLLHSECDEKTLAFRLADEVVCLGPSQINESYLHIQRNIDAAKSVGADAIHPGFGFLSENADFAEACAKNRLTFIGPSPESIRLFGNKISAKNLVDKLNIPTIPGYQGDNQEIDFLVQKCEEIGFPVIVKASGGGGGRGLKVAKSKSEAVEAIESAKREGKNAFGSSNVFLERYLDRAKHIEVQIFADFSGNVYHLSERDCSVQRRHQKVIEEGPANAISFSMRQKLANYAVEIAKSAKYLSAGTVEFLVQDNECFFLEMNTRLQVEHPVTELILGVDLVKAQIQTAQELPLSWKQDELMPRGHAIECRIYAEDPFQGGIPSTGILGSCYWPLGSGRRFEVGFEKGDEVTSNYDSMIAKVIVWDENRHRCIEKMKNTLKQSVIFGVRTNIPYLLAILDHSEFCSGEMSTQFINKYFSQALKKQKFAFDAEEVRKQLAVTQTGAPQVGAPAELSPWQSQNWKS